MAWRLLEVALEGRSIFEGRVAGLASCDEALERIPGFPLRHEPMLRLWDHAVRDACRRDGLRGRGHLCVRWFLFLLFRVLLIEVEIGLDSIRVGAILRRPRRRTLAFASSAAASLLPRLARFRASRTLSCAWEGNRGPT